MKLRKCTVNVMAALVSLFVAGTGNAQDKSKAGSEAITEPARRGSPEAARDPAARASGVDRAARRGG